MMMNEEFKMLILCIFLLVSFVMEVTSQGNAKKTPRKQPKATVTESPQSSR